MAKAHSRVCLVGEDLDWTGGMSILCPINLYTEITINSNNSNNIIIKSMNKTKYILLNQLNNYNYNADFFDYIIAGLKTFSNFYLVSYVGINIEIESNIPIKSGLSSSAALFIALFKELGRFYNIKISIDELCQLGRMTEVNELKAVVGTMDFYACAVDKIILFNEQEMKIKKYNYSFDKNKIVLIYSGVSSSTKTVNKGKKTRFEMKEKNFMNYVKYGNELVKRLDHQLSINAEISEIGETVFKAHDIMKKYLKNSNEIIDKIVDICKKNGAYGAKLTGCGEGGYVFCVISLKKLKRLCKNLEEENLYYSVI
ncbi:hypothetical protein DW736_14200 [Coprobacillus sp. AM28-15LB]|jgi:mevalonate kinase|uniref:mevalonate kinase family protein n=1 Tax=Faecalibacillus intestinalis TaxID=1982626 RepID=UPI000E4EAD38|nr:hypothetical protein DW736_14200 [Coprobacillus sp. AM28-15LB]